MRIYIGLTELRDEVILQKIRSELAIVLRRFYGIFPVESTQFFIQNNGKIEVYVMETAKYRGYERVIEDNIKSTLSRYIAADEVYVRLDYSLFDPKFNPISPQVKETNDVLSSDSEQKSEEFDYDKLSQNYHAEMPRYSFDQVILPQSVTEKILEAIGTIQVEQKVFDEWGLRTIIPNASSAISFYGPPGTGKSMAAEAIAQKLNKKILRATYADIESKYHGEGPKMVKAIFKAAERDDAVLFLDESDSLLSKRLTNVADGSAQAINSMRSQLLICLEQFKGIVIFATNLVINYDKAFLSRLINIEFVMPDTEAREKIWFQHTMGPGLRIPLAEDIDLHELAESYVFCGREIKNCVKDACVTAALAGKTIVSQEDFKKAAEKIKIESERLAVAEDQTKTPVLTDAQAQALKNAAQKAIDQSESVSLHDIEE